MIHQAKGILDFEARGVPILDSINAKLESMSEQSRWVKMATGITAAFTAFNTISSWVNHAWEGVEKLADATAESIDSTERLSRSLNRFGIVGREGISRVNEQIEQLRKNSTGFGSTELANGLDQFILKTHDAAKAAEQYGLVVDVAARLTGGDLKRAIDIVSAGMAGEFKELGRLLPEIKAFSREHKDLTGTAEGVNFALGTLRDLIGGGAKEERNTLHGATAAMKDEWEELRESLAKNLFRNDTVTQINMVTTAIGDMHARMDQVAENRFFQAFFGTAAAVPSVVGSVWARILGIDVGTLRSRTNRANAPSIADLRRADDTFSPRVEPPDVKGGKVKPGLADPFFNTSPSDDDPVQRMNRRYMQVVDISTKQYQAIADAYSASLDKMDARGEQWVRDDAARQRIAGQATVAVMQATSRVVSGLLLKEHVDRLKGLEVIKYVSAQGAAAVVGGLAQEAGSRGALAAIKATEALFEGNFAKAAGLGATALKYSLFAGVAGGVAAAISGGAEKEYQRGTSALKSGGAASGSSSGAGGSASPGSRIVQAGAAPSAINYIVNVSYQGSVIYGNGGTREWFERELLPLIREARQMGALAAA